MNGSVQPDQRASRPPMMTTRIKENVRRSSPAKPSTRTAGQCSQCRMFSSLSLAMLERHMILTCTARDPLLAHEIKQLRNLADKNGLDPMSLVRLTLEMKCIEWAEKYRDIAYVFSSAEGMQQTLLLWTMLQKEYAQIATTTDTSLAIKLVQEAEVKYHLWPLQDNPNPDEFATSSPKVDADFGQFDEQDLAYMKRIDHCIKAIARRDLERIYLHHFTAPGSDLTFESFT